MNMALDRSGLRAMISPASIAILGASSDFQKINGRPLKYLLEKGYQGRIYPVNPKYDRIDDLPCYPGVDAIPGPVDLAIIALPAKDVIPAVRELGAKGVPAAIVFSSGFGEMGPGGRELERQLVNEARRAGVRLCGPNCLGLINAFDRVVATFSQYAAGDTPAGPVGFVTQSGAFGTAIAASVGRAGSVREARSSVQVRATDGAQPLTIRSAQREHRQAQGQLLSHRNGHIDTGGIGRQGIHTRIVDQVGIRRKQHIQSLIKLLGHRREAPPALPGHTGTNPSPPEVIPLGCALQHPGDGHRLGQHQPEPVENRVAGLKLPGGFDRALLKLADVDPKHSPQN